MAIARNIDTRCTVCLTVYHDVYCKSGEEPACVCGAPVAIYWGDSGRSAARRADNFTPLDFEGKHYNTREEWDAHVAYVERNTGQRVEVVSHSKRLASARADEVRHKGWLERRRLGLDNASAIADARAANPNLRKRN